MVYICQQESQSGVLQVTMFFLTCSVVMLLSVVLSTDPLVLYWAAAAPRRVFVRHGCTSLPDALERALVRPTLLRVRSLTLFFSVRFLRYMRTVSPSYAKQSSLVVYAGECHGAQPYQPRVSVGTCERLRAREHADVVLVPKLVGPPVEGDFLRLGLWVINRQ